MAGSSTFPDGDTGRVRAPRIVAYAYNSVPTGGSEHAAGWVWVRMLAGFADVWVITLPMGELRPDYERRLGQVPEQARIHFVEVEEPGWLLRVPVLRHPGRFHRFKYVAWQFAALRVARRLHRKRPFDVAWHLTWANSWLGSTLSLLDVPFVFGPVGGGVEPPWRLASVLGARGLFLELQRTIVRRLARRLNPLAHVTWRRARLILVQNPDTQRWLPRRYRDKCVLFPNAVLEHVNPIRPDRPPGGRTALYAGRLIPLKGVPLALEAIAKLPAWRLVILGDGSEEARLRDHAARLGISERVEFRGMQTRDEVLRVMREEADVLVFPSFHDEGSLAVAEAVASGLPVVCLDRGGPPVLGGVAVPIGSRRETVRLLAAEIARSNEAGPPSHPPFDLETRRRDLAGLLAAFGVFDLPTDDSAS
jgi:glycosyltransferase involved in cell wall biosynthesis